MFLEIITPDENVFEGEVDFATFPGSDGSFQVFSDHAPMVASLGTGDLKIVATHDKKTKETLMSVDGGVVEILNNKVLVLAEHIGE